MAVKLRLQRRGRAKAPFYHIVVADSRSPRDGRFIEKLGTYNPLTVPATIDLNRDLAYDWLQKGAQPTDTVRAILRFKGVLYQKHLADGVKKGALTAEQAEAKLNAWIEQKEARISVRREESAEKHRQHIAAVDGKPKAKVVKPVVVEEPAAPEVEESAAPVVEEVVVAEAVVAEVEDAAPAVVVEETESAPAEDAAPVVEADSNEEAAATEENTEA